MRQSLPHLADIHRWCEEKAELADLCCQSVVLISPLFMPVETTYLQSSRSPATVSQLLTISAFFVWHLLLFACSARFTSPCYLKNHLLLALLVFTGSSYGHYSFLVSPDTMQSVIRTIPVTRSVFCHSFYFYILCLYFLVLCLLTWAIYYWLSISQTKISLNELEFTCWLSIL